MAKVKVVIESDEDINVKVTPKAGCLGKLLKDIQNADGEGSGENEN